MDYIGGEMNGNQWCEEHKFWVFIFLLVFVLLFIVGCCNGCCYLRGVIR